MDPAPAYQDQVRGRNTVVCQTRISDASGKLIALVTQTQLVMAPSV